MKWFELWYEWAVNSGVVSPGPKAREELEKAFWAGSDLAYWDEGYNCPKPEWLPENIKVRG